MRGQRSSTLSCSCPGIFNLQLASQANCTAESTDGTNHPWFTASPAFSSGTRVDRSRAPHGVRHGGNRRPPRVQSKAPG